MQHRRNFAPSPWRRWLVLACLAIGTLWASSTRVAAAGSELDVPPALFFGPRLQLTGPLSELTVGQTLQASLPGPLHAYRASGWRWRRAASPQPWSPDMETVTSLAFHNNEYTIQARDAGYFLSACLHLAVARDLVSEYCTPFLGPVLYEDEASPCAADGDRSLAAPAARPMRIRPRSAGAGGAGRPADADPPPQRGRWRLLPALDGHRWREPVALLPWPAGGWAVAERGGRILRHRPGQPPCLLLDLTAAIGRLRNENGLLSLALDPQFPVAPFLYVYYTRRMRAARSMQSRLARFSVADGRLPREEELVLLETAPRPHRDAHFGGALGFGPDGLLYLGLGDRNASEHAPQLDSLLGKILRLDVRQATRARPYRIPAANPWRGQAGARPEAYARGFRNPWRLAFDPRDGALWVADVGGGRREEVNRVQAGADYGWPLWEGDLCQGKPAACAARDAAPVAAYVHAQGNCAVIGGVVYRGAALPGLDGAYLFGDHCSGRVWALTPRAGGGWRMRQLLQLPPGRRLMAFAAADDAVYLLVADGAVLQLAPS